MDDLREPARDSSTPQEVSVADNTSSRHSVLWLALDQGGHASRALVYDGTGKQIVQAFAPINTQRMGQDRVEHDPLEILESLRIVIADVAQSLGSDVRRIQGAGLATQRSSIVCWDARDGTPLSPVLSWQDRRNQALIDTLQPHREEIQRITGLVLSPHYGASKLRWCMDELPAVRNAYQQQHLQCGPLASYLLRGLLNEHPHVVDPANASRTQLWSPATGEWSSPLLQRFGVPREVLPQAVATHHRYGSLQVDQCSVPLQVCTGDQAAVPFAMGALRPNSIYLNAGTGAFMLAPLSSDIGDAAPLLRSVIYSDSTQTLFALEGTVNGAGSALQWFGERSAIDVQRALPLVQRPLNNQHIPLFINAVGGLGSPYWLSNIKPEFVDTVDKDEATALTSVIESIAFMIADNVALMKRHLPPLDHIIAGGGVSASRYLCECIASLTGLSVTRTSEPELTAKGLAWLLTGQPSQWNQSTNNILYAVKPDELLTKRWQQWKQHIKNAISHF